MSAPSWPSFSIVYSATLPEPEMAQVVQMCLREFLLRARLPATLVEKLERALQSESRAEAIVAFGAVT